MSAEVPSGVGRNGNVGLLLSRQITEALRWSALTLMFSKPSLNNGCCDRALKEFTSMVIFNVMLLCYLLIASWG